MKVLYGRTLVMHPVFTPLLVIAAGIFVFVVLRFVKHAQIEKKPRSDLDKLKRIRRRSEEITKTTKPKKQSGISDWP